jgi:gliding motility-associated-like protein
MRKIRFLSTLVLTVLLCSNASAQDFSNKGKDFWLAYGYHERMIGGGNSQQMVLYFAADQNSNVTVSIPALGYTQAYFVPAGSVVTSAPIPKVAPQDARLTSEGYSNNGIHITSDKAIVAYAHIYNNNVSGATILYPTNTLGKEYYSINFTNISNVNLPPPQTLGSNCWFYVIAADTGTTTVEIKPSANTIGGWVAGTTYTITLTQGQIYNVMGIYSGNSGVDLTGSVVKSINTGTGCKKIGVFSGSGRISITCNGSSSSSDNYMVQAVPKAAWGKKYLTVGTAPNMSNNFYRICVSDPTTVVTLNGGPVGAPLQNNFYYEIGGAGFNSPQLIEADKPIMVAQYITSQSACGNGSPGDPEVIYLSPVEQNINRVLWNATPNFAITQHYINVVIPNTGTAISSFRLDGMAIPPASFITHPGDPNFSYIRTGVTAGQHLIQSDSGFNAIAYGYGNFESYGYNAGTNIKDLFQFIKIKNPLGTVPFPATCRNTPFRLSMVFPYRPTQIDWIFGPPLNAMGFNDTTIFNGGAPLTEDSSWVVAGRTIYEYRLPRTYTITANGTYPIKVIAVNPTPDGCGNTQEIDFDLEVFEPPVADFTFTTNGCFNSPVAFFDNSNTGGRPVISRFWDFDDGNTATINNPTHTYAAPGAYDVKYTLITDVGCLADTVMHTVALDLLPTAQFSVAPPLCPNVPITFTDQSVANGSSTLAQWTWDFGDGSPVVVRTSSTNEVHTYTTPGTYTATLQVETTTGCESTVYSMQITILNDGTITLSSAPGTDNQTVCINTPITNITYAVGGSSNGGSVTGLPAGVSGSYAGGVITISGTPTVAGVFTYTVTTTGPCVNPTTTGTITVTPDGTVTLTSAPGTDNQTLCINTPLTNITYAVGGSGTGGNVTGLPAGVTGSFAGGVITISGTPTVAGTFNYTVNTTGPCVNPTATGTITVTPDGTVTLTSAPGTDNQTVCINTPITNITYVVGGSGTGGSVTGLPAGVSGSYAGGVITISGTPTVSGVFTYTVTTTGPCVNPTATGTINVNPDATITRTSPPGTDNQELCVNSPITNITYAVGGTGTGANATGLPAGVTGSFAGGVFTISGSPTVSGTFSYTVTTTGICAPASATGTILVNALPTANFSHSTPSCETGIVSFTDLSVANSGTIVSWAWNFGDGGTSTLQNPTHVYAAAGTYNVTLVVTTDKGCVSINPAQQVVIYAKPQAGFIVPEVCLNDTYAQFTDTSSVAAPDNITAWAWDFGDGGTSTLQNPQHSYTAVGSYNVRLIVTTNRGCRDTIIQTIFVNGSFPQANFTLLNPTGLCANDSVAIVEASTVFPGTITKIEIYWDNVGFPAVFDTDNAPFTGKVYKHLYPNFQAPLTRNFVIRYRAYSGGVCVDDTLRSITVNAAPLVQFNPIPNICLDAAPYQITQASEIGGIPGSGVFSGPGVSPSGLFTPSVAGPGVHTIKYKYTSNSGCMDSLTQTIKVWEPPIADYTVSAPVCERQAVTFTDNSVSTEGSITQWRWNFNDGTPVVVRTSGAPFTHTFSTYGTFNVTLNVITSNGCVSTPKMITVDVKPLARPNFTYPAISCLPNANVTFNNTTTIPGAAQNTLAFLWNFGDPGSGPVNTSTAVNPSHSYAAVGPYNVNLQVTSADGCVHDTTIVLNTIHPQPLASFTTDKVDVCIGGSITFTNTSDPMDGTLQSLVWDMDDGNTRTSPSFSYTYAAVGTYDVSLYIYNSFNCRSTLFTKTVSVNPYPPVNAGPSKFMLEGGQVQLTPTVNVSYPITYSWSPGRYLDDSTIAMPIARPPDDMYFRLTVTTDKGCSAWDTMFVKVLKKPDIPNIFSPNGDGVNDTWVIRYLESYPGCTVEVVNRYGQLVFRSVGYSKPWDGKINGKDAPVGTYYYVVTPRNGRAPLTGYVDLIR